MRLPRPIFQHPRGELKVAGDEKLEVKGKVQKVGGEAQAKLGEVRRELQDSSKKGA
jgi:uncharacterized protein YjbJ (UPF0337 family)